MLLLRLKYLRSVAYARRYMLDSLSEWAKREGRSAFRAEWERGIGDGLKIPKSQKVRAARRAMRSESFTYVQGYAIGELTLCLALAGGVAGSSPPEPEEALRRGLDPDHPGTPRLVVSGRYFGSACRLVSRLAAIDPRLNEGDYSVEALDASLRHPLYLAAVAIWLENWRAGGEFPGLVEVLRKLKRVERRYLRSQAA